MRNEDGYSTNNGILKGRYCTCCLLENIHKFKLGGEIQVFANLWNLIWHKPSLLGSFFFPIQNAFYLTFIVVRHSYQTNWRGMW